jgi:hypothetical protein
MATWKKVIVSGSNISQLDNDSGYLIVTDNIDSASVAAVATTLSPQATASFADRATTASFADLAGTLRTGATASFADRATSASIADSISQLATASFAINSTTSSHALTLSQLATASFALVAGTARNADSASVAARATTLSTDATASFALVAGTARNADSASVAARATTLSVDATASFANSATTASFALTGRGVFSGSFSGSFQGDGSGLSGIASTLAIDADTGGPSSVNLSTQTLDIAGTANEIETSVSSQTITIGLPNDVTIGQDLTVSRDALITRNLTVQGTASFQNTTDLDVADRFIRLASGSNAAGEGGFVVQQGSNGFGEVFGYDNDTLRFGLTSSFDARQNSFVPDAYFTNVVEGLGGNTPGGVVAKYTKKGNVFVSASGDIYIYS